MSTKYSLSSFTSAEIDGYRYLFENALREIAQARQAAGSPYPDEVIVLLDKAMSSPLLDKNGDFVDDTDRINGIREHPVSRWVAEQCRQKEVLERAWSRSKGTKGLEAWAQPEPVQALMRKERAWRFWAQYVLSCYQTLVDNTELRALKDAVATVEEFVNGATRTWNALEALLADSRLMKAASPQEVPAMRVLRQTLPELIRTFKEADVEKLYPYKNKRPEASSRAVARDVAELAWRNLGRCDAGLLAKLLSDLEMPKGSFEEKWYGEQSNEAEKLIANYEERRRTFIVNLPRDEEVDLYRPCLTDSPWLGTWRTTDRKRSVKCVS